MSTDRVILSRFPDVSPPRKAIDSQALWRMLSGCGPGCSRGRSQRDGPIPQDFGASLAVVLGTAAATAVAKGIAAWMARNSGVQVGEISVETE